MQKHNYLVRDYSTELQITLYFQDFDTAWANFMNRVRDGHHMVLQNLRTGIKVEYKKKIYEGVNLE